MNQVLDKPGVRGIRVKYTQSSGGDSQHSVG